MLVQAIANEVGANLFDLSPANIAGKYPGKEGLKMLMHLIYKVGGFICSCFESYNMHVSYIYSVIM